MYNNVGNSDDISYETAFGTANSICFSDNYPFVIDGETKYFARIEFNCTTDTNEINSWLMKNGAANLADIVDHYWGSAALTRLKTDSNVLFCVEPIQIVSSVDDDGDQVAPNVGTRTVTYEKEFWKRVYDYFYDYTCMETLQGLSASELSTAAGRKWRTAYSDPDNTKREGLDSKVWPEAFERMEQFIQDTGLSKDDLNMDYD